ncbi:hypothetical protein PENTCL1PPCAC_12321, partial [Pristionchus entomophagus]
SSISLVACGRLGLNEAIHLLLLLPLVVHAFWENINPCYGNNVCLVFVDKTCYVLGKWIAPPLGVVWDSNTHEDCLGYNYEELVLGLVIGLTTLNTWSIEVTTYEECPIDTILLQKCHFEIHE